jgi:spore coat protein U-like protein
MRKYMLVIGLAACLALSVASAQAATATGDLTVSATVSGACSVDASSALAFGTFVLSAGIDITDGISTTFTVTCTAGVNYSVVLNSGLHGVGGPQRKMASAGTPADLLNYDLWQNAGGTTAWDSSPVAATGNGAAQIYNVFGSIPGSQGPLSTDSYEDTVQVTVTY